MDASPKTTFSARRGSIFAFLGLAPLSGLLTLVSALDIPPQISPSITSRARPLMMNITSSQSSWTWSGIMLPTAVTFNPIETFLVPTVLGARSNLDTRLGIRSSPSTSAAATKGTLLITFILLNGLFRAGGHGGFQQRLYNFWRQEGQKYPAAGRAVNRQPGANDSGHELE
jgi:hypothetical protein